MRNYWPSTLIGLFGVAFALAPAPASAQSVEEFYKGKTVTIYVGYSPGGGYDTYSRTVARYIGKHIPGNPSVIVSNRPGAGSMRLANELYNILPKDGTAIGVVGNGLPTEALFGAKEAMYDPREFNWIGAANSNEVNVCMSWHTSPVKTLEDLLTMPMTVGGTGPGAETDTYPRMLNDLLGTQLKLVTGYPGSNDVLLAMERGEVEGICGQSWSTVKSRRAAWLSEGKLNLLIQMAPEKHPDLQHLPLMLDEVKDEKDRATLELFFAPLGFGRPFVAPPDVPADRVEALRDAFMATLADPDFLADAEKQNLEADPIRGERVGALIADMYKASPETIQHVKELSGR